MTSKNQHPVNGVASQQGLKTEYVERPVRRQFSTEYKRRILKEAAACKGNGAVGALLRRAGLYSSHLTTWRRQEARGELSGKGTAQRGRKAKEQDDEVAELRRENAKLAQQLEQARYIIDAPKKVSLALEQTLHESEDKS